MAGRALLATGALVLARRTSLLAQHQFRQTTHGTEQNMEGNLPQMIDLPEKLEIVQEAQNSGRQAGVAAGAQRAPIMNP